MPNVLNEKFRINFLKSPYLSNFLTANTFRVERHCTQCPQLHLQYSKVTRVNNKFKQYWNYINLCTGFIVEEFIVRGKCL